MKLKLKHFYLLPRLIHSLVFLWRIFVTWVHCMPLVKVGRCLLTVKRNFYSSSHSISCPLFCAVLFILKTNSSFTICVCENGIFYSPFILFHSQLSWKQKFPSAMFDEPEKIASFSSKLNCITWCVFFFSVGAWIAQVHHITASF